MASPSGKLSTKLTEEVLSSIGKTSLMLDFATFPERGKQELSPYFVASPRGEALPRSGGDEGQLHFRKLENISNRLRPLIENFDIKFQSKMCCAPHSLRFRSAPSPQGEGFFIALSLGFPFLASPSGRLSTKLTEEVLSSIGKTSLTLDFATFPERGKQELSPYLSPLRSACRAAISFSYPRPFGV